MPLPATALLAAWGVAFVLALGELPATNLVAPPGTMPLTVLIWSLLHSGVESHLAGVALDHARRHRRRRRAGGLVLARLARVGTFPGD